MFFQWRRKLSAYFGKNKYYYLLIFLVFAAGVAMGVRSVTTGGQDSAAVAGSLQSGQYAYTEIIRMSFLKNVKFVFWIFLCSLSILGIPAIAFLLYTKVYSLGCSICALLMATSQANKFTVMAAILPQIFFTVLSFVFLSQCGAGFSMDLCRKTLFGENVRGSYLAQLGGVALVFGVSVLFVFLSAVCEGFFVPPVG